MSDTFYLIIEIITWILAGFVALVVIFWLYVDYVILTKKEREEAREDARKEMAKIQASRRPQRKPKGYLLGVIPVY
jgi:flagellar biosynthesis/type III secretory pathway M-ring protein FliF/YscJ